MPLVPFVFCSHVSSLGLIPFFRPVLLRVKRWESFNFSPSLGSVEETKRRKVMFIVGRLKGCLIMVPLIKRTRWILPQTSYIPFYKISLLLFLSFMYIFVCRLTAKKKKKNFKRQWLISLRFPRVHLTRTPRSIFQPIFNSYVLMKFLPRNMFDSFYARPFNWRESYIQVYIYNNVRFKRRCTFKFVKNMIQIFL